MTRIRNAALLNCDRTLQWLQNRKELHLGIADELAVEYRALASRANELERLIEEHRSSVIQRWHLRKAVRAARLAIQAEQSIRMPRLVKKAKIDPTLDPRTLSKKLYCNSWAVSAGFWKSGIYGLFQRDKLVYIGLAENLSRRIHEHVREGAKQFDRVGCLAVPKESLRYVEKLLLDSTTPELNRDLRTVAIRDGRLSIGITANPPTPAA